MLRSLAMPFRLCLAVLAVGAALLPPVLACARPPASEADVPDSLRKAEEKFKAGDLLEAAALYQRAAETNADLRGASFERLVGIYLRLGRLDRALHYALRSLELLQQDARRRGETPDVKVRRRALDLQIGELYLALGHYRSAETHLRRVLADVPGLDPLPAPQVLETLTSLARCAEKRGDSAEAGRLWARIEERADGELGRAGEFLGPRQRIEYVWKLADSYRFQGKPAKAIARLASLPALHDKLGDPAGKRDTLRRLAGHYAALAQPGRAAECLRQALALHETAPDRGDRLLRGDLAGELAEALATQDRGQEADKWRQQADQDYSAVLKAAGNTGPEVARKVSAFWKLEKLYQRTSQFRRALSLAQAQADQWAGSPLYDPKIRSEQGTLQVLLGAFADARPALREAVAALQVQSPPNLIDLPRAQITLAIVEQAGGDSERAEELARKCLDLYKRYEIADDLIVVEAHNVLGTSAATSGRYALAVERFRDGIRLCEKLGPAADAAQSNLLLNLALLHKSQGDLVEALGGCQQARAVYARTAPPEYDLGFAAFDAALAALHTARGQTAEAYALTTPILKLCRRYEIEGGPLLVTALHCQGMYHLSRREYAAAEDAWSRVLAIQEKEKYTPLLPRTLNGLGFAAEKQGKADRAEALYARARDLQKDNPRDLPAIHFITLWRLADVVDRKGRHAEARGLLEQALALVESARLQTYGDAKQRAAFFAQFAPGFEDLIRSYLRDGEVEAAFDVVTRSRSRTLLDQLQLASVDPRAELQGPDGDRLRRQEQELREKISGLRARAQMIVVDDAESERAKTLLTALDEAQRSYADIWREILNASPLYRNLAAEHQSGDLLATLRGHALGPKTLMLVYHIGRERSHLLLLGGKSVRSEAFPLTVPARVAERLDLPSAPPAEVAHTASRGFLLKPKVPQPPNAPGESGAAEKEEKPSPPVPLNQFLARALVDHYLAELTDPGLESTRGFRLTSRNPGKPLPVQRLELLGHVLLPPAVRARIREHAPDTLVVVPDGPLHKLPLEAILLESGARPHYVLDELPPIVYVPSAAVLALVAARPRPAADAPLSLLTVSNPAYPQEVARNADVAARPVPRGLVGLRGQLPLLPFTAVESKRIRQHFGAGQVTVLEGAKATKRAVTTAVAGKRMIHLAVHGFADDRFGNLFGALALTPPPPGKVAPEDDGFLSLHEIYRLPLQDCELAVLSACVTNVGPQQPLEAGVTLASGFLAAGARRVVASHWSVDDESTATLMEAFFAEVTAAARHGEVVAYAQALQKARRKVRETPKWSAPFFWAPFVLVGAAEERAAGASK
jgi:CHAT domain-containing protein/tetratricopeptide (TPR) repeat protein